MPVRLEKPVEYSLVAFYKRIKGIAFKWVSPGNTGVMDRICLSYVPPEHREIVAKYVNLIECKAPGMALEKHQIRMRDRLKKLGYAVYTLAIKVPKTVETLDELKDSGLLK